MSDASSFAKDWEAVRVAVGSVLVGQDDVVEGVLTALFAGGHVLLEGVPGWAKPSWFELWGPHWAWTSAGSNSPLT